MPEFYRKLTDGTIKNQKPDGQEIISSMKRAKITSPCIIEWSEMCFCSPPLKHERQTIYDKYLTDMQIQKTSDYEDFKGDSFFDFLKNSHQN